MKKLFIKFKYRYLLAPIIVFAFFAPKILLSKIPIPADTLLGLYHPWRDNSYANYNPYKFPVKNPIITDPILQTLPWKMATVNNIKNLSLPLWNPYSFSGQPLLANVQSAPLQVLNIFYFLFNYKFAWSIQIILPPIMTSIFMYLFLKNRGLSHYSSTFGSIVLPFSGFFTAWLTWGTIITTAMWLPLILFTIDKLSKKITPYYYLILIFALTQTLLSGHTQTAIYILLASYSYLIFTIIESKNLKLLAFVLIATILAVLISSPQLLPSMEFAYFSNRQLDQSYWPGRQDWFLPVKHLIQLLAPDFFGNPTTNNYWGVWNYKEFVSFIGLVPIFLAMNTMRMLNKKNMFFISLLSISLLLAVENPISKLPYIYSIPIISSLQPSRIIFLFVFSLSVLSAYGLDNFIKLKHSNFSLITSLLIITSILVLIASTFFTKNLFPYYENLNTTSIALRNLYIPFIYSLLIFIIVILKRYGISQKIIILTIFFLTVIELFRFSYKFTPFVDQALIFPRTKITDYLKAQKKPFRVAVTDRRIANPNSLTAYGIESISGYDPLYLKSYATFVNSWQNNKAENAAAFNRYITPEKLLNPISDLLNVNYILTFDEINNENYTKVLDEGLTKLYLNTKVLPRAFFPQQVIKVNSDTEMLNKITDPLANFKNTSYSLDSGSINTNVTSTSQIVKYSDQNISIKTTLNKNSPIIISNIYYPGWNAYIDKKIIPIKKINYIFQTIDIPEGEHLLELKYQPASFYNGLYLSALGLMVTIILSFYLWHKKYQ